MEGAENKQVQKKVTKPKTTGWKRPKRKVHGISPIQQVCRGGPQQKVSHECAVWLGSAGLRRSEESLLKQSLQPC